MREAFGGALDASEVEGAMTTTVGAFEINTILPGRVVSRTDAGVVVDVGMKSEGFIPIDEWDEPDSIRPGDTVEVLLEAVEGESGTVVLSKRKADRIRGWNRIMTECKEGDRVKGKVTRKIKGGLLVDIGVPVFLPASQIDIRRPGDVNEYMGKEIDAVVLKIDGDRRNIVISRRKLIEEERAAAKARLMSDLEVGQLRKGVVKNIADFGAFIDLGGIDGLLHITDMSWDRIGHPSELLRIDDVIEVRILNVDKDKEKIALGLKQTKENPWDAVEQKYPIGTRLSGEIVNLVNYGAFVRLEAGVEGLVHVSEMSWTRRINHPSEIVNVGDKIDVIVLEINKDKQEISLGMKQTEVNPWLRVAEKYPPNTVVTGKVRNLTNYGAFVEIEEGIDGLLHVSDLSWTKKVSHPSEILKKGEEMKCVVLQVDQEKQRISLGLKQLVEDPWLRAVPERYIPGMIVKGLVTKITNFGVFVELEQDLEGLLHVSELADHKVDDPHKEVKIGDEIEVKILRVDNAERKIGLSKKRADWATASTEGGEAAARAGRPRARRGGLHGPGEVSTDLISSEAFLKPAPGAESTAEETPAETAEESTDNV
ncbi:MAG: 30S ribosomal protein S1 [Phycisphaerae bacterium]|nr:30S ribosomal protein S1 [Phycisphaerae bacterium]